MSHVSMDSLGWVTKSPVLLSSLHRAHAYATQQQHRQITLEHLLLALTEDSDALAVLHASKVDIERLRSAVSDLVGRNEDRVIIPDLAGPTASSDVITIFEYASAAADQSGRGQIDGAIVLAALIGEGNSSAARLLESHGLTFEHAIASLQNRVADAPAPAPVPPTRELAPPPPQSPQVPPQASLQGQTETTEQALRRAQEPAQRPPQERPQERSQQQTQEHPIITSPLATSVTPPPSVAPPKPRLSQPAPQQVPQQAPAHPQQQAQQPTTPTMPQPVRPTAPPARAPGPAAAPRPATTSAPVPAQNEIRSPTNEMHPGAEQGGMIAPWPDPETAAQPPQAQRQMRPPQPAQAGSVNGIGTPSGAPNLQKRQLVQSQPGTKPAVVIEEGQLIENIPRKMRVAVSEQVEVRIARNSVNVPTENMQGHGQAQSHGLYVTKAMTVRLRAPEGGVRIETSSPETQWIDNALGLIQDDFASWRWTITPEFRGTKKLQLVVSARTVGADGVAAETALPDQVFDVVVRMNYFRTAKRLGGWAVAAAAGGAITAFGEDTYAKILALVNQI